MKNNHKLHAFLMSDMLLFAEEKSNLFKDYQYVLYRQPLPMNAVLALDVNRPPPDDAVFEIIDVGSEVRATAAAVVLRPRTDLETTAEPGRGQESPGGRRRIAQNKKRTAYRATSQADKRRWVTKIEAAYSHYLVRPAERRGRPGCGPFAR